MSESGEIPADVRNAARAACLEAGIDNPFGAEEAIAARAILAERERAARILEARAARIEEGLRFRPVPEAVELRSVAAAIRNPES